jgi:signal transduction histidine kinase/CheY-like chemotaxis protein
MKLVPHRMRTRLIWGILTATVPLAAESALRVGYGNLPPFAYPGANGEAAGFQVDVLREAARRARVELVWVHVGAGPDSCLLPGTCDLFATAVRTPEREALYHFARPWWRMMKAYLVLRESPIRRLEDLSGRRIAVNQVAITRRMAADELATRDFFIGRNSGEALEAVCRGTAEAAFFMGQEAIDLSIARPPACRDSAFRLIQSPMGLELTFAAQPGLWRQTDAIRRAIDEMAFSGQISQLAAKHGLFADLESHLLVARAEKSQRETLIYAIVTFSALALGAVLGLLWRLRAAYRQVRNALDWAQRSDQAKSAFLATMSHEIRTPMNAIQGMTDLLLETPLTPVQRDQALTVRRAAHGLLNMLNDVLDLSKIEAGKLIVASVPFNAGAVAEESAELFSGSASEKGLRFYFDCPPRQPLGVIGDAGRLRQVIHNLLSNAIKFTDSGWISLTCRSRLEPGGVALQIDVADSGVGIPEARLGDLFKDFSQVDASHSRRHNGTGLGLSISRRLAEAMGGWLSVSSELGQGSVFSLTLTLPAAPDLELPVSQASPGLRVLLQVEDESERRIVTEELTAQEASVTLPDSSDQSGAIASGFDFAFLTADGLSGRAASEVLDPLHRAGVPAAQVVLLGNCPAPLRMALEAAGVQHFLARPLQARAIAATLVPPDSLPAERPQPESHPANVLVVEDNPVNQRLATILLERMGCRVEVAANGFAAIQRVQGQAYDLILMDVQMPEMDGFAATRAIRAGELGRRTPIVAMTANVFDNDRAECLAAGMDGFLAKPIDLAQLRDAVKRFAREDQTRSATA